MLIDPDLVAPAVAVALVLAIPFGLAWARFAGTGWLLGIITAASAGVIVALTTVAVGGVPDDDYVLGVCDLRRLGPGTLDELLSFGEATLNVLLFVPLGLCIGLHPVAGRRLVALAGGAALPFVVELVQLELPELGRYCDGMDIADNLLGLVLGFAAGYGLLALARLVRGPARAGLDSTEGSSERVV